MRRHIVISWHRFYDPATGRYISADPIGLRGGMNLYAYVGGNPVNFIDPMGLVTCTNVKYGYISMCIEKYKDDLEKCECKPDPAACKSAAKSRFKSCLKKVHDQCTEDLNSDGKEDAWDKIIWALGRTLGPLGGTSSPGFGDEGPGAIDPVLLPSGHPEAYHPDEI